MHPPPDNNNMQTEQIQHWTTASFLAGLFNAVFNGVAAWGVSEWVAVLGVVGMVSSLFMQRHYNLRRDRREAEKHEWERQRYSKPQRKNNDNG